MNRKRRVAETKKRIRAFRRSRDQDALGADLYHAKRRAENPAAQTYYYGDIPSQELLLRKSMEAWASPLELSLAIQRMIKRIFKFYNIKHVEKEING